MEVLVRVVISFFTSRLAGVVLGLMVTIMSIFSPVLMRNALVKASREVDNE